MTKSHFGCVQRVGDGRYRIFWTEPSGEGSTRMSKTVHGTREDAENALALMRIRERGTDGTCTLSQYWITAVEPSFGGLAARTSAEYKRLWVRELEPRFGGMRLGDIDRTAVERGLNSIASASVQRAAYRLLKKVLNMALRDRIIAHNPVDRYIRLSPHRRKQKEILTGFDVGWWLESIRGIKYEPLLLLELGGGLRVEEACALVWHRDVELVRYRTASYIAVNIDKALVVVPGEGRHVKETKTESSTRKILIGEPFASRLLELMPPEAVPVCPANPRAAAREAYTAEDYTSPATVTHNYRAWCKRRGVRYVPPKNLRSSFATLHGEAGSPDSVVSGIMGHTDGTTKGRNYQSVTLTAMAAAADGLAAYLDDVCAESHALDYVLAGQGGYAH